MVVRAVHSHTHIGRHGNIHLIDYPGVDRQDQIHSGVAAGERTALAGTGQKRADKQERSKAD